MAFGISFAISLIALQGDSLRTLGERAFGRLIFFSVNLCIAVVLADGWELWIAWAELRKLLVYLDRLPLRRTLRALKHLEWGSIWKLSGNVLEDRYRVLTLQTESLRHLANIVSEWSPDPSTAVDRTQILKQLEDCQKKRDVFVKWYIGIPLHVSDLTALHDFQKELAKTAGLVMQHILIPAWRKEKDSLLFDRAPAEENEENSISTVKVEPYVLAAEEFFVLPYLGFIQNILGRLRTMALGSLWLFVGATLAVSSYPFDPLNVLGVIFLTVFVITGGLMIVVYSQISRDRDLLSHITNTRPGELGGDFWMRLLTFGGRPLDPDCSPRSFRQSPTSCSPGLSRVCKH